MKPFCTAFITDYQNVNPDSTITLPRLMAYAQEASLQHSEYAGYPMDWFMVHRCGFILTHWQIEITAYPKWNRQIQIKTWPTKMRGLIAERAFTIRSENGTPLLFANSNWVYMDLSAKKPLHISPKMAENYGPPAPSELPRDYKLPKLDPSEFQALGKNVLTVTRRDIDTNLHVNNQKYMEWALDYIPDEVYQTRRPASIKVHYKKECVKDQTVLVETHKKTGSQKGEEFISQIRNAQQQDVILTEIWSKWR